MPSPSPYDSPFHPNLHVGRRLIKAIYFTIFATCMQETVASNNLCSGILWHSGSSNHIIHYNCMMRSQPFNMLVGRQRGMRWLNPSIYVGLCLVWPFGLNLYSHIRYFFMFSFKSIIRSSILEWIPEMLLDFILYFYSRQTIVWARFFDANASKTLTLAQIFRR